MRWIFESESRHIFLTLSVLTLAASAACGSTSGFDSGDETALVACEVSTDCNALGEGYTCVRSAEQIQGECRQVYTSDANSEGSGGRGSSGTGPDGSGTSAASAAGAASGSEPATADDATGSSLPRAWGEPCEDSGCEAGLSCVAPAGSTVRYCTKLCDGNGTMSSDCSEYTGPGQMLCLSIDLDNPGAGSVCALQCEDYGLQELVSCPTCDGTCPAGLHCTQPMSGLDPNTGQPTRIGTRCSGVDGALGERTVDAAAPQPPGPDCDAHIIIDHGGSLGIDDRLTAVREAVQRVIYEGGYQVSLLHTPVLAEGAPSCTVSDYSAPLAPLGGSPAMLQSALDSLTIVSAQSPMDVALEGAYEYVRSTPRRAGVDRAVIFITTDSAPSGCAGSTIARMVSLAEAAMAVDGIRAEVLAFGTSAYNYLPVSTAGGMNSTGEGLTVSVDAIAQELRASLLECAGR